MPVRLTDYEIKAIKELAKKFFGEDSKVFIFGSRAHLEKRGGDIDIYIETKLSIKEIAKNKIKFLAELDLKIGEQKTDLVVFNPLVMKKELIHKVALEEGIEI
ncbi:MAG: nucleotidyltransferase domain-containing protein [Spirochaetales bacterium]|jgi:predicted nucleotidyltransferase|nr:nucleotidyltransferase domain-containing protein [Exilispira sp.]NMC68417.1 nucleotidyltransferase domain-containing protein [Spirochaetales bacterium]